ncbi:MULTISPECIES: sugar phosphate isomerase/epimerase family protein [Pseudomonas syringae group]|uniref:Xylose isomerase domain protein TIM barrel n=1 Tax=Pseudomonas syringae pv. spinaceae TaxID=264459 RepID=A0A0Q0JIM3_PSESX|nr:MULTISPECIES: sugar phosphate isomerase/epimerase family protein [Pseudomonas syringae group]KPW49452.1 Xylose isomerase domain protein TIM barrel [Pseudomonas syringae pv. berberidis]KPY20144.1 Xylose isomerase domain protein TIM barrel [Pseudomonas syringae pv. philadelphi]KPZ14243.1 Xylose isomerase domain protein TIM barrel [Pseudomonas syringae pv. spinaceae]RMM17448.1 Xylose isomerase domain protein TIM barrel [Pseudomonas syringae pv. berberidis]RMP66922.1 Xylose isomerase domain pro
MSNQNVELLAAYFTLSGDVYPFGPTEISPFAFRDRVEAAAEAGYKGVGLIHVDLMSTVDRIGFREMRHILEANGIKHIEFEFLTDWYLDGEARRASDKMRAELFNAAQELGARAVKTAPGLHQEEANIPLMVEHFGNLSAEAATFGTDIVLEIMPFSNVRTIDTALALVQGANHDNGKLLLDIWHLARGGVDFSEIARIPAKFIGSVELDDADKYAVEPLWQDTIHRRRLPGEGVLDVPGFIKAIQATGYAGPWGVEVLSEVVRKLPLQEMAQRTFETTMSQFK